MTSEFGWENVHIGSHGDGFAMSGMDVWKHEWQQVETAGLQLALHHGSSEAGRFEVYEMTDGVSKVRFAAREISPGVRSFYAAPDEPVTFEKTKRAEAIRAYLAETGRIG